MSSTYWERLKVLKEAENKHEDSQRTVENKPEISAAGYKINVEEEKTVSGSGAVLEKWKDTANPFSFNEEEKTIVSVISETLDAKKERLKMIANNKSPLTYTNLYASAQLARFLGSKDQAEIMEFIGDTCLQLEVSKTGKDNRVNKVLSAIEAAMKGQLDLDKSTGEKATKWL